MPWIESSPKSARLAEGASSPGSRFTREATVAQMNFRVEVEAGDGVGDGSASGMAAAAVAAGRTSAIGSGRLDGAGSAAAAVPGETGSNQ
jgi:hypothetical protein